MNKICVYTCLFQWRLVIKFVCGVQSWMDKRYGLLDQVFCIKTIFFYYLWASLSEGAGRQ